MQPESKKVVDLEGLGAQDAIRMLECASLREMKELEQVLQDHALNVACAAQNHALNVACATRDHALNVACAAQNHAMNIACAVGLVSEHLGKTTRS